MNCFIIPCICSNSFSRRVTSCTCTPAPAAVRGLRVASSSGYSPENAGRELKLGEGKNFLQKPFSADTLSEIVRRALDTPPAAA